MPDLLSHALFAQQLLDRGGFAHEADCVAHSNLFRLGSQGPDLFYYLAYVSPGRAFRALADQLHALRAESLVPLAADAGLSASGRAYLCGVIAHLCLDGAAHPYIERRSAEIAAAEPGVGEGCAHVRLESCVEARQLAELAGKQPKDYDICGDLPAGDAERQTVLAVWQRICAEQGQPPLGDKTASAVLSGLRRLPLLFSVVFDRHDIAKRALDFFHRFSKGDSALRWHIKRPYDPARSPLAEADAVEIEARYSAALAEYPTLFA